MNNESKGKGAKKSDEDEEMVETGSENAETLEVEGKAAVAAAE